jgi:hypothetical protein
VKAAKASRRANVGIAIKPEVVDVRVMTALSAHSLVAVSDAVGCDGRKSGQVFV